jgi:hypothetical protein
MPKVVTQTRHQNLSGQPASPVIASAPTRATVW